ASAGEAGLPPASRSAEKAGPPCLFCLSRGNIRDLMRETQLPRPVVTVATIVMRDDAFLIVEEETRVGVRLNQPAGHLEAGETLVAAAVRETLEETGHRIAPTALVGIYRWQAADTGATFIRFAFAGEVLAHE